MIDVSNPAAPTLAGTYNTPGYAWSVYVSGDHAFVADNVSGLQVIDISNPAAPTLAGTYDTPGLATGVYVSGDHAFVADGVSGLQVIDISNPAASHPRRNLRHAVCCLRRPMSLETTPLWRIGNRGSR